MEDQYDALRERYDSLVKGVIPKLTAETVDEAIGAVNTLIRFQRPVSWAVSNEPGAVLGITSDGVKIAYREDSRFGFYHAVPAAELQDRVSGMLDKARTEYGYNKNDQNAFSHQASYERLQHVKSLLENLVALRSE